MNKIFKQAKKSKKKKTNKYIQATDLKCIYNYYINNNRIVFCKS